KPPLGGGVTSSAAIDEAKGVVYVSVGDCVASSSSGFGEALVALDAETGSLRWAFKPLPAGDAGDLDFIASPNAFTASGGTAGGQLVGVGNKNGIYYAVNQDTGALVWQKSVVPADPLGGFNASNGVAYGNIYAGTFTGPPFIFALNATNGGLAWECP